MINYIELFCDIDKEVVNYNISEIQNYIKSEEFFEELKYSNIETLRYLNGIISNVKDEDGRYFFQLTYRGRL